MVNIRQTARKSTGSRQDNDPVRNRMNRLLITKRENSDSPNHPRVMPAAGSGKGKRICRANPDPRPVKLPPKAKPGELVLKEIKKLQSTFNFLIPRGPFHRVIREVTQELSKANQGSEIRYQAAALIALQEAAESFLVRLFEDSYLCTIHAKRVTLFVQDMHLCKRLQRNSGIF